MNQIHAKFKNYSGFSFSALNQHWRPGGADYDDPIRIVGFFSRLTK